MTPDASEGTALQKYTGAYSVTIMYAEFLNIKYCSHTFCAHLPMRVIISLNQFVFNHTWIKSIFKISDMDFYIINVIYIDFSVFFGIMYLICLFAHTLCLFFMYYVRIYVEKYV